MRDHYAILGVSRDATAEQIKRQYLQLALVHHPDKGGDVEVMKLITVAYEELYDEDKRHIYNGQLNAYERRREGYQPFVYTPALSHGGQAYSKDYRKKHSDKVGEFLLKPIAKIDATKVFSAFKSIIEDYSVTTTWPNRSLSALFIRAREGYETSLGIIPDLTERLTPALAVETLINYLQGEYKETRLIEIRNYLRIAVSRAAIEEDTFNLLYQGVAEIIQLDEVTDDIQLLTSIKKISDCAKHQYHLAANPLMKLLQNSYFRDLFARALHFYWSLDSSALSADQLTPFDDGEVIERRLKELDDSLAGTAPTIPPEAWNAQYKLLNILQAFNQYAFEVSEEIVGAEYYRTIGFAIIDWLPAMASSTALPIVANRYLQAGCYFQLAAAIEENAARGAADEYLAHTLFCEAIISTQRSGIYLEQYFRINILKQYARFQYHHDFLKPIIAELQAEALEIANTFPIFEPLQPGIMLVENCAFGDQIFSSLVKSLVGVIEENDTKAEPPVGLIYPVPEFKMFKVEEGKTYIQFKEGIEDTVTSIHIVGPFNHWGSPDERGHIIPDPSYALNRVNGLWKLTIDRDLSGHECKFVINGGEKWLPEGPNLQIKEVQTTAFEFYRLNGKTHIVLRTGEDIPAPTSVHLAGEMNNWLNPSATGQIVANNDYEFKFNDGVWRLTIEAKLTGQHCKFVFDGGLSWYPHGDNVLINTKPANPWPFVLDGHSSRLTAAQIADYRRYKTPLDHDVVTIIYYAFVNTVLNPHALQFGSFAYPKFRGWLIAELLKRKRWDISAVAENADAKGIFVDRSSEGWMVQATRTPIADDPQLEVFQSIDGVSIDYTTGKVDFSFKSWKATDPWHKRLLTLHDVIKMIEGKIGYAQFSLDQADFTKPMHPFQKIFFTPASVYQSPLYHEMLLADYLLKFFTTGVEVNPMPPFMMRSIEHLIEHLPNVLKQIILDFKKGQSSLIPHRFWIEAYRINEAQSGTLIDNFKIALDGLKMVIKKHRLTYNELGELVDDKDNFEGWDIFVLTAEQLQQIRVGIVEPPSPGILFEVGTSHFYFSEEGVLSRAFMLNHHRAELRKLFELPKEASGKLTRDEDNAWLLYTLTKAASEQAGKPHNFTKEYCFAIEFTAHYDAFAEFFPVFGRLRELAKTSVVIRQIIGIDNGYKKLISELEAKLADEAYWQGRQAVIDTMVMQVNADYAASMAAHELSRESSLEEVLATDRTQYERLLSSIHAELMDRYRQYNSIKFRSYSPEVKKICEERYAAFKKKIIAERDESHWRENEHHYRNEVYALADEYAAQLTQAHKNQIYNSLYDAYKSELLEQLGSHNYHMAIICVLNSSPRALFEPLRSRILDSLINSIHRNLSKVIYLTCDEVAKAFANDKAIIKELAKRIAKATSYEVTASKDRKVKEIRDLIRREREAICLTRDRSLAIRRRFQELGLPEGEVAVDLEGKCLWLPTAMNLEGRYGVVYGGVKITPDVSYIAPSSAHHRVMMTSVFTNPAQKVVGATFVAAAKTTAAAARVPFTQFPTYLRTQELARQRAAAVNAAERARVQAQTQAAVAKTAGVAAAAAQAAVAKAAERARAQAQRQNQTRGAVRPRAPSGDGEGEGGGIGGSSLIRARAAAEAEAKVNPLHTARKQSAQASAARGARGQGWGSGIVSGLNSLLSSLVRLNSGGRFSVAEVRAASNVGSAKPPVAAPARGSAQGVERGMAEGVRETPRAPVAAAGGGSRGGNGSGGGRRPPGGRDGMDALQAARLASLRARQAKEAKAAGIKEEPMRAEPVRTEPAAPAPVKTFEEMLDILEARDKSLSRATVETSSSATEARVSTGVGTGAGDGVAGAGVRRPSSPRMFGELYDYDEPAHPSGSAGAARTWTIQARIKAAQLPNEGKIRFVPDHLYHASEPLLRGTNNGYLDRFGNEWTRGPSRTAGQPFEWDVQLSPLGVKHLGWASRDGKHINVSLDGKITHR